MKFKLAKASGDAKNNFKTQEEIEGRHHAYLVAKMYFW